VGRPEGDSDNKSARVAKENSLSIHGRRRRARQAPGPHADEVLDRVEGEQPPVVQQKLPLQQSVV